MATLTANLLGAVALALDGQPLKFARRSSLALAVYLGCAGRSQSRGALAALIAGESDEPKAAMALSNALRDLRTMLGDHLVADSRTVALAPTLVVTTDVEHFQAAVAQAAGEADRALLRAATARYGGEFAHGLTLRGAPDFDEWLQQERARLHHLYLDALERLANAEARAGNLQDAIAATRRMLAEEPWREEVHRGLMRLLARDGQRAAALLQFERCREALGRELGIAPQPETLTLYEQLQAGPIAPPHNLPARATTFVDRPGERALLSAQLQRPGCRLVTLVGIGGTGKTRLALEVASQFTLPGLADELAFPDGVYLMTCAEQDRSDPADDPASEQRVWMLIRHSLGLTGDAGASPRTAILSWLANRTLLLVFDSAEFEPALAAVIADLLGNAPGVRMLVTSRLRLRLEAEWVLDLGGLSVPTSADDLPGSGAGQLFLERARAVRLANPPGLGEYAAIARICQLVNGMPLAVVLAAGRLRTLSCAEIVEHVARDTALLVSDSADLPARQRNLGAVLRWSWEQLGPQEAGALRHMAVFRGDFDLSAAIAVCACELSVLDALADYGLLAYSTARTYSLHPLVRHLASEELARLPAELARAEERHAAHFANLAAQVVGGPGRDLAGLRELTAHWSDLQGAWAWAVAQHHRPYISLMHSGMARTWDALGLFREGIAQCRRAVVALRGGLPPQTLAPDDATAIAELLLTAAWLHTRLAETNLSLELMEQARVYAARGGAEGLLARIDLQQGMQLYLQTRYRAARPLLERAVGLAMRRGDGGAALDGLSALARLAYRQGDTALMHEVVTAAERHFDDRSSSLEMHYIRFAEVHLDLTHGDFGPARALLKQHEHLPANPHHHQLQFWYWSLQMRVAGAAGRLAEAEQLLRSAQQLAESLNNGFVKVSALVELGEAILAQGDVDEADQVFTRALRRAIAVDAPYHRCAALVGRARAAEANGEHRRAESLAGQALQLALEEQYRRLARHAQATLGRAQAGIGRYLEAADCYTQALVADELAGHRAQAAEMATAMAELRLLQGDGPGGARLIAPHLALLLSGNLEGMVEPLRTLACAERVLRAGDDPRADLLAAQAGDELGRRAGLVTPERSAAFLSRAAARRAAAVDG